MLMSPPELESLVVRSVELVLEHLSVKKVSLKSHSVMSLVSVSLNLMKMPVSLMMLPESL